MKKLSVNGKTFEKIFKERGVAIMHSDIKIDSIYFAHSRRNTFMWIFKAKSMDESEVFDSECLDEEGNYDSYPEIGYLNEFFGFCEATPNQISLLEAYRHNA